MEIIEGSRVPLWSWAVDVEPGTLEQARNVANLPIALEHVALMSDAHSGFGMPIGGVLFTDAAVVPYAVGVDISCGVTAARTNLLWTDTLTPEKLRAILRQIQRDIPTGPNGHKVPPYKHDRLLELMGMDLPENRVLPHDWFARATLQIGTLGGGNHFAEIEVDDTGQVYFMLHSGSRHLGKQICDKYVQMAMKYCERAGYVLDDKNLAWLSLDDQAGQDYWEAMTFAMRWAEINRRTMLDRVEEAFRKHASVRTFERLTDVHHNFVAIEEHDGQTGVVHRKGAVRASEGEMVLIPGSMGVGSYIAEGLGSVASYASCQHGAGRRLGRNAAKRAKTSEEVFAEMRAWGIEFFSGEPKDAAEEAAFAYKDLDAVMAASADLVRPLVRLHPLGVVKG